MNADQIQQLSHSISDNISKVIVGKESMIRYLLISILCGGHVLLEDLPGTGKTTTAKALAKSIDCDCKRVQFTPDLLPSDLTGINFYNQKQQEFVFKAGPVFTNILLADEINRATPRTQSSLLECMEEGQVTIDGQTYPLQQPFLVLATQNPIETQGTFPLPEAQLDRFFMQLSMGYPSPEEEQAILSRFAGTSPLSQLTPAATKEDILEARASLSSIKISDALKEYIVAVSSATRTQDKIALGVSPRGSLCLMRAAAAYAATDGRDFVLPDDVKAVAKPVLAHRLILKGYGVGRSGVTAESAVDEILNTVKAPRE